LKKATKKFEAKEDRLRYLETCRAKFLEKANRIKSKKAKKKENEND